MIRGMNMKKALALLLSLALVFGILGVASAEGSGKLTMLLDDATTQSNFDEYLAAAEAATGLDIEVIPMPSNTTDRTAKVFTILSSGDSSVDIISVEQEMIVGLKNTDYIADLSEIMTDEVKAAYPEAFIEMSNGNGIPMFMEIFCFWVNNQYLESSGISEIKTLDDFKAFMEAMKEQDVYGYGGGWEQTYVFNDIAEFVNLFGGDFYDWSNENTQAAAKFAKELVDNGWTSLSQLADQYNELNQRIMDGDVACMLNYSSFMPTYVNAERYGEDDIQIKPMLDFGSETTFANGWQYVVNASAANMDSAMIFMEWAASAEGQKVYAQTFNRLPGRLDVIDDEDFYVSGLEDLRSYLTETTLVPRPMPANSSDFLNEVGALFQRYVSDELSFEDYVSSMQECVDEFFA